ncbi:MAG: RNHCP domain-containing protein [Candidatus Paceibacterota bacterium]|jgi:Zn finger protein HypA/HybF involved in hydrogenase expression
MTKRFQRNIEDFKCENCGNEVTGNGYTNHCPKCLYSKHVDINPGDRASSCGGLMEPIGIEKKNREERIIHRCKKCRFEKANKIQKDDNFDLIVEISKKQK